MKCTVDTSGLSKAMDERLRFPGRTEAQVCNHAAYSVAHRAIGYMPFSTQERIDTELGVATNLLLTKRGKFVRNKRKHTKTGGAMGEDVPDTTLAKLIILARANLLHKGKQSNYNRRTNNRWQLNPSDLKGGEAVIQSFISRMIKSRHSSTKFILSGFAAIKKKLSPYVSRKQSSPVKNVNPDLGDASPAVEGKWSVQAVIENLVGAEGPNAENHNRALVEYGQPALQQAIDDENQDLYRVMDEMTRKQNEKFNSMCR